MVKTIKFAHEGFEHRPLTDAEYLPNHCGPTAVRALLGEGSPSRADIACLFQVRGGSELAFPGGTGVVPGGVNPEIYHPFLVSDLGMERLTSGVEGEELPKALDVLYKGGIRDAIVDIPGHTFAIKGGVIIDHPDYRVYREPKPYGSGDTYDRVKAVHVYPDRKEIRPEKLAALRSEVDKAKASGLARAFCLERLREAEAAFDSAKTKEDIDAAQELVALWRGYCSRGDLVADRSFCEKQRDMYERNVRMLTQLTDAHPNIAELKDGKAVAVARMDWWSERCAEARLPDKEYCDRKLAQAKERLANWKSWEGKKKQAQYAKEVKEWSALCSKPDTWFDPWAYIDPENPGPASPPYNYEDYRPPPPARRGRKAAVAVKRAPVLQLPPPEPPPTRKRRGAGRPGKGGGALPSITIQR